MIDILVALTFAGCIWGIARAWGRRPDYRRVAGWTAFGMFGVAAYTEFSIASDGMMAPSLGRLIPIMLFAVVMFRLGRKSRPESGPVADMLADTPIAGWTARAQDLVQRIGRELDPEAAEEQDGRAMVEGA